MPTHVSTIALERFTNFGDLLKFLRRRQGLTQRELSIAVGYSDAQISRLELNQRVPDIATITARFIPVLGLREEPEVARRLLELAESMSLVESPAPGISPFKGLYAFEEGDAAMYFGREELTASLLKKITTAFDTTSPQRFFGIIGASGSGKSSLLKAGLLPVLRRNPPFSQSLIFELTPTARPLQALSACLTATGPVTAITSLMDGLAADPRTLHIYTSQLHQKQVKSLPVLRARVRPDVLVLIDQFEELFTLCTDETERRAFIDNLMTAATQRDGSTCILMTLRADFYHHFGPYLALRDAFANHQEYIGPMQAEDLRRAIEEPARLGRWELEPGLAEVLLRDLGADSLHGPEPGALPLLSHSLLETWHRRHGRLMTVSGYLASGGVHGAIAETADIVYQDELDSDQQAIARRIFLHLTQVSGDFSTIDTRRRVSREELVRHPQEAAPVEAVLSKLVEARLLTVDEGVVDVAHEAIIREWPRLQSWLEQDREGIRIHRHLSQTARSWIQQDRDPGELYRGVRLAQAVAWAHAHPDELASQERDFLQASKELSSREEAEREAQRRRELKAAQDLADTQQRAAAQLRRRAFYLSGAFLLAVIMAAVALFQGEQARKTAILAQNDRRVAFARELSAASASSLEVDPERGILLALQAVETTRNFDGSILPEAIESLHRSILASRLRMTLTGMEQWVLSTRYSPDGRYLAAIGKDGTTLVWDANTGEEQYRIPGSTPPSDAFGVQRLSFSPDSQSLVTSDSNLVHIRDTATGDLKNTLSGHTSEVWAVEVSPDGSYIASVGTDAAIHIWDAKTGVLLRLLEGHQLAVEELAFHPDGKTIASVSDDMTLKLWDVLTGDLILDRKDFSTEIYGVAYSPDGRFLASASPEGLRIWAADDASGPEVLIIPENVNNIVFNPDGEWVAAITGSLIKLWDVHTGKDLMTLSGHAGWAIDLSFSPDGKRIASTSFDETVKVWDVTPGRENITLPGNGSHTVFSPDGSLIATDGNDGSATLWDAVTGAEMIRLEGHAAPVMGLAFSPDGERLATASLDATVNVWEVRTGNTLFTLIGHEVGVRDVAYSPDGRWIATAGFDQTARLWNAETGAEMKIFNGHTGLVLGVAFSPDGKRLATTSTDKTAKLWDIASGQLIITLTGHMDPIPDVAFSPDGSRLVTGSQDGTGKVWDAVTGAEYYTIDGHDSEIQSVSFSPDGKRLATGSGDNTAKIWDIGTGKELLTLPGSLGGVFGVAFSPQAQNQQLAVASTDGIVRIYLLETESLIELGQARVTRELTVKECQKYLHLDNCPAITQ